MERSFKSAEWRIIRNIGLGIVLPALLCIAGWTGASYAKEGQPNSPTPVIQTMEEAGLTELPEDIRKTQNSVFFVDAEVPPGAPPECAFSTVACVTRDDQFQLYAIKYNTGASETFTITVPTGGIAPNGKRDFEATGIRHSTFITARNVITDGQTPTTGFAQFVGEQEYTSASYGSVGFTMTVNAANSNNLLRSQYVGEQNDNPVTESVYVFVGNRPDLAATVDTSGNPISIRQDEPFTVTISNKGPEGHSVSGAFFAFSGEHVTISPADGCTALAPDLAVCELPELEAEDIRHYVFRVLESFRKPIGVTGTTLKTRIYLRLPHIDPHPEDNAVETPVQLVSHQLIPIALHENQEPSDQRVLIPIVSNR